MKNILFIFLIFVGFPTFSQIHIDTLSIEKVSVKYTRVGEIIRETSKKSTNPNDFITDSTINYRMLDSLIFIELNKYRKSKGLSSLNWNQSTYEFSKEWSDTIADSYNLRHTPSRVRFKEKIDSEICIGYLSINRTTYVSLSKKIIKGWESSPKHNKIMISNYKNVSFGSSIRYLNVSSDSFNTTELFIWSTGQFTK